MKQKKFCFIANGEICSLLTVMNDSELMKYAEVKYLGYIFDDSWTQ